MASPSGGYGVAEMRATSTRQAAPARALELHVGKGPTAQVATTHLGDEAPHGSRRAQRASEHDGTRVSRVRGKARDRISLELTSRHSAMPAPLTAAQYDALHARRDALREEMAEIGFSHVKVSSL